MILGLFASNLPRIRVCLIIVGAEVRDEIAKGLEHVKEKVNQGATGSNAGTEMNTEYPGEPDR